MAGQGRRLVAKHSRHGYKHTRKRLDRAGKCCVSGNLAEATFDNIVALCVKRNQSVSSFVSDLVEFALMELEEQGELVLNKHKEKRDARRS